MVKPPAEESSDSEFSGGETSWEVFGDEDVEEGPLIDTNEAGPEAQEAEERDRARHRDEVLQEEELARRQETGEDLESCEIEAVRRQLAADIAAQERRNNEKAVQDAERAISQPEFVISNLATVSSTPAKEGAKPAKPPRFRVPTSLPTISQTPEEAVEEAEQNQTTQMVLEAAQAVEKRQEEEQRRFDEGEAHLAASTAALLAQEAIDPDGNEEVIQIHLINLRSPPSSAPATCHRLGDRRRLLSRPPKRSTPDRGTHLSMASKPRRRAHQDPPHQAKSQQNLRDSASRDSGGRHRDLGGNRANRWRTYGLGRGSRSLTLSIASRSRCETAGMPRRRELLWRN